MFIDVFRNPNRCQTVSILRTPTFIGQNEFNLAININVACFLISKRLQIAASAKQTPSQIRIIAPLATRHLRNGRKSHAESTSTMEIRQNRGTSGQLKGFLRCLEPQNGCFKRSFEAVFICFHRFLGSQAIDQRHAAWFARRRACGIAS